jgi:transcriptional regulator with XRE-family HTH domain
MKYSNEISDIIIIIGRNIKKYRKEKGITQQELAFHCDKTDRSTISNLECFNCNGVNISTIIRICIVLEIDICKIFINA